ncbi:fumarylacetoacetate (FAA) hydrolase [Hasllibacter halocynthiae]|uniref:Fumarylacetoacetate (FAA) hydrolase n=1 Tax=Hasllibacter halocynthiae TaxID=595589 RepID=A0A2T0X217_9RHOB|nr:fumarylacetoacetate hydrolase family protein [Hasllibacter halocynthiae]PRY92980.1 fumarylacetoacetate (FAA) hydrolase [Hasllibacter halocynthiae]
MRLASLREGPDGPLVKLSADGRRMARAGTTLQHALDDWDRWEPKLRHLVPDKPAGRLGAVLPRAFQFLDGSAYVNHVELVRRARGAEMPERFWTDPLMYQGCSTFLSPNAPIEGDATWGIDCEAEVAVITGPVPMGADEAEAAHAIRLVTILNDVSLRNLVPDELGKGFGFVQSKPPSALAPVAVTPDALPGWDGARLHGTMHVEVNGLALGRADAGHDMTFGFPALIAHAARTRALPAGTVIGSGTVSNRDPDGPGRPVADGGRGYSCIAEQRMVETILGGEARTPFLEVGDRVRIWMGDEVAPPFGVIDQKVVAAPG